MREASVKGKISAEEAVMSLLLITGPALLAARGWTFRAARRQGRAAASRVFLFFCFGGVTP